MCSKFPQPPLLPDTPQQRAFARGLAQIISCDVHPLNNLRVLQYLDKELSTTQPHIDRWYRHWIMQGFEAFERHLQSRNSQTAFCCDDQPGLADLCLVPQVYNAQRYHCDLEAFPTIRSTVDHCLNITAFQDAAPEAQADAL